MAAVSPRRSSSGVIPAVVMPNTPGSATSSGALASPIVPSGDFPLPDDAAPAPARPTLAARVMALPLAVRFGVLALIALTAIIVMIRVAVGRGGDEPDVSTPTTPAAPDTPHQSPIAVPSETVLVDVAGLPPQARVRVDGLPVGAMPMRVRRGGRLVLEIEAPGYELRRIDLTPNENMRVSAEMRPSL